MVTMLQNHAGKVKKKRTVKTEKKISIIKDQLLHISRKKLCSSSLFSFKALIKLHHATCKSPEVS